MKIIPYLVIAVFCVTTFTAQASSYVVVATGTGTEYAPGDMIEGDLSITLEKGNQLTLINSLGKKISVKGPFKGALDVYLNKPGEQGAASGSNEAAGVDVDLVQSLARLFKTRFVDTGSLGAFRSLSAGNELSDAWMLDSGKLGHFCSAKSKPIQLWRRPENTIKEVQIQLEGTNEKGATRWEANAKSASWPAELPVNDGASYLVRTRGEDAIKRLVLHILPDDLPTRAHQAVWMAEQKCETQAVLLVVSADVEAFLDDMIKKGDF